MDQNPMENVVERNGRWSKQHRSVNNIKQATKKGAIHKRNPGTGYTHPLFISQRAKAARAAGARSSTNASVPVHSAPLPKTTDRLPSLAQRFRSIFRRSPKG